MDIKDLRQQYTRAGLGRQDLKDDPFEQFEILFQEACAANLLEPNAWADYGDRRLARFES